LQLLEGYLTELRSLRNVSRDDLGDLEEFAAVVSRFL